jgi:hypothetical protein
MDSRGWKSQSISSASIAFEKSRVARRIASQIFRAFARP